MNLALILQLLINVSMGIVVLSLGLRLSFRHETYLLSQPSLLIRSVLSMSVIMPVIAIALVLLFDLHPAVKIGIVTLALSPVPPVLPMTQRRAGGGVEYIFSLLLIAALLSLIVIPIGLFVMSAIFDVGQGFSAASVIVVLGITVVAPLLIGIGVHHIAPAFAERIAKPVAIVGYVLLLLSLLPVLFMEGGTIIALVGNGTLLALAVFTIIGIAVGHMLGGPDPADRSVLALATGARHPGVALAIASAAFPSQTEIIAVVLWHLIVSAVIGGFYVRWRNRAEKVEHAS